MCAVHRIFFLLNFSMNVFSKKTFLNLMLRLLLISFLFFIFIYFLIYLRFFLFFFLLAYFFYLFKCVSFHFFLLPFFLFFQSNSCVHFGMSFVISNFADEILCVDKYGRLKVKQMSAIRPTDSILFRLLDLTDTSNPGE